MYGLSPADLELQARARAFADELIPFEVEAELAGGHLEPELAEKHHRRAIQQGLYATNMPESLGGHGCTLLQQVLVQEQVGRVTNGLAWVAHTPAAWWAEVATPYQRDRWLLPTVRGEMQECYAITEEGAGSDVDAITATARRDGDDYLLDGVKWHVTSYDHAAYAFVQAKLAGGDHALFVVDLPSPGVRVVRTPAYTHSLTHHHPIVAFEGVRVPKEHLIGAEGDGMSFSYAWFRFERLMVAARCLGAAERLIAEADAFAATRIVNGEPLRDRQLIAAMLADSVTELFAARSMVYETARAHDDDAKLAHARCSMVKLFASEMANRVADRAVQIFGGRGYMRENVAERMFRELRVERIWEGASEVQRLIIAGQLAKRGVSGIC
ncbi:acyl-CoA dehydrogenase family protein [Cryptosporangium sp. NPDC051539]|uniref:acyl-CoA dehydrogenase family protein n=1 Tax=Cryptosporangium sp. NPDC051539 TaxID=3363962 RepID=UPI0037ACCC8E